MIIFHSLASNTTLTSTTMVDFKYVAASKQSIIFQKSNHFQSFNQINIYPICEKNLKFRDKLSTTKVFPKKRGKLKRLSKSSHALLNQI